MSEEGGLPAEDADSEGEEGKFYLWTNAELISVLGKEDAAYYGNKFQFETKGNYHDEATQELTGKNIPHLPIELVNQETKEISKFAKASCSQKKDLTHRSMTRY